MSVPEYTVAAVSFLNARPLIDGLENDPSISLLTDVPSRLLETLIEDRATVALCPVIDFQLADADLCILPVGGIGSDGATHTVRVFSRRPIEEIEKVHTDSDSHTSVALLDVVIETLYGRRPELVKLGHRPPGEALYPEALLLIGDKVVHDEPNPDLFPYQIDLGEAWKQLTGLPFVFATWLARTGNDLGDLPDRLHRCRERNINRIPEIVSAHADGWPHDLAERYLARILRYEVGEPELRSIELFWARCHELGIFPRLRRLNLYTTPGS